MLGSVESSQSPNMVTMPWGKSCNGFPVFPYHEQVYYQSPGPVHADLCYHLHISLPQENSAPAWNVPPSPGPRFMLSYHSAEGTRELWVVILPFPGLLLCM
jgi:hypothetical protein